MSRYIIKSSIAGVRLVYSRLERSNPLPFVLRVESYSCKMAGNEKQMYKKFNADQGMNPNDLQALSPPQTGVSPGQGIYRSVNQYQSWAT